MNPIAQAQRTSGLPPYQPDFRTIAEVAANSGAIVKVSYDSGDSWEFARLSREPLCGKDGSPNGAGLFYPRQTVLLLGAMPVQWGSQTGDTINQSELDRGVLVRIASSEEIPKDTKFTTPY